MATKRAATAAEIALLAAIDRTSREAGAGCQVCGLETDKLVLHRRPRAKATDTSAILLCDRCYRLIAASLVIRGGADG